MTTSSVPRTPTGVSHGIFAIIRVNGPKIVFTPDRFPSCEAIASPPSIGTAPPRTTYLTPMNTEVHLADTPTHRMAYVGSLDAPDAQMTFSRAGEGMIIIDHTEVSDRLRGQGMGRKLLDRLVTFARENQLKVIPLCPFAKSVFDKDASIGDVLR